MPTIQPASVNFFLYAGATFTAPVTLKDSSGNPIDLTNYTGKLQARRDIADLTPVFSCSTTDGTMVMGGTAGTVTLNQTAIQTAAMGIDWSGEIFFHDLLITHPDGVTIDKPYYGVIIAVPSVTRA